MDQVDRVNPVSQIESFMWPAILNHMKKKNKATYNTFQRLFDDNNEVKYTSKMSQYQVARQIVINLIVSIVVSIVFLQTSNAYVNDLTIAHSLNMSHSEYLQAKDQLVDAVFISVPSSIPSILARNCFPSYTKPHEVVLRDTNIHTIEMYIKSWFSYTIDPTVLLQNDTVFIYLSVAEAHTSKTNSMFFLLNDGNEKHGAKVEMTIENDQIIYSIPLQMILDTATQESLLHLTNESIYEMIDLNFIDVINLNTIYDTLHDLPLITSTLFLFYYLYATAKRPSLKRITTSLLQVLLLFLLLKPHTGIIVPQNSRIYDIVQSIPQQLQLLKNQNIPVQFNRTTNVFTVGQTDVLQTGIAKLLNESVQELNDAVLISDLLSLSPGYTDDDVPIIEWIKDSDAKTMLLNRLDTLVVTFTENVQNRSNKLYKLNADFTADEVTSTSGLLKENSHTFALYKHQVALLHNSTKLSTIEYDYIRKQLDRLAFTSDYDIIPRNLSHMEYLTVSRAVQYFLDPIDDLAPIKQDLRNINAMDTHVASKLSTIIRALDLIDENRGLLRLLSTVVFSSNMPEYLRIELQRPINKQVLDKYKITGDKTSIELILYFNQLNVIFLPDATVRRLEADFSIQPNFIKVSGPTVADFLNVK